MNPMSLIESLGRAAFEGGLLMLGVWAVCRLKPGLPAWVRGGLWWLASARLLIGLLPLAPLPIQAPLPMTAVWWPAALAAPAPSVDAGAAMVATQAGVPGEPVTAAPSSPAPPRVTAAPRGFDPAWLPLGLCAVWALGVVVRSVGLCRQFRRVRRARRASWPAEDRLAASLGAPETRLAISPLAPVPMVTGLLRPVVLLPEAMLSRPRSEMRLAVAHEMAHLRRGDLWFAWVPAMAEALFWFHPWVPMAVREYVQACEEACDEEALRATGANPYDYGRLLLALGVHRRFSGATAMPCGSPSPSQLTRRLSVLEFFDPLKPRVRRAAVGLLCAFALVGLAPLRVVPTAAAPRPDSGRAPEAEPASLEVTAGVEATEGSTWTVTVEAQESAERWKSPDPPSAPEPEEAPDPEVAPGDLPGDEWDLEDPPIPPQPAVAPRAPRTPAVPVTPRAPRAPKSGVGWSYETGDDATNPFAYVLVHHDSQNMNGSGNAADWKEVARWKRQLDHDFLWVRDGDRRYLIEDSEVLERIEEAFAPMSEIGERQSKIGEIQSEIGDRQSEIGEEQARIGERQAEIGEEQARMAERMAGRPMRGESAREFDRRMEELSDRMEELGRLQERLGARMEPLGRQQEELGARMEALAREMERVSRTAQRTVRTLIDRAIRDGKARRLP